MRNVTKLSPQETVGLPVGSAFVLFRASSVPAETQVPPGASYCVGTSHPSKILFLMTHTKDEVPKTKLVPAFFFFFFFFNHFWI